MLLRVVDAGPDEVTIKVEMIVNGRPLALPARRVERRDLNRPRAHARRVGAELTAVEERVTVAGRAWAARRLDTAWTDEEIEYHRTTWLAETAPAYGILRMRQTAAGRPVASMELIAFGAEDREP